MQGHRDQAFGGQRQRFFDMPDFVALELGMRLGGHARVGIEDNIYISRSVLAEGSAPLVGRAAAYARSIGRPVADPAQARLLLGLGESR